MRSFLLAAVVLSPVLALPVRQIASCPRVQPIDIVAYDQDSQYLKFNFPYSTESTDASLVFDVEAPQCREFGTDECFDIVVNGQRLQLQPDSLEQSSLVTAATETTIQIYDTLGLPRTVELRARLSAVADASTERPPSSYQPASQRIQFHIQSVDGQSATSNDISAHWTRSSKGKAEIAYLVAMRSGKVDLVDFQCLGGVDETATLLQHHDDRDDIAEEEYITGEIEALRLLEQQASDLQIEIALRKQNVGLRSAKHRSRRPLKDLIEQCDGVLCAAKQIATRLCDNINLATTSADGYTKLQQPFNQAQQLDRLSQNHTTTDEQFLEELGNSDDYIMKALVYIASILGLTTIVAFIRRKCMSMRSRVENAADREERRNVRAYRRAARRAEMRLCWEDFLQSLNCFKVKQPPRLTDYDEKRALILQDALLEQDLSQLEKGDVMEAEIRELRHAHEIVSNIIQSTGKAGLMLAKDPPPPLVPLPATPTARSRASTGTLPSYNSEEPPDYSSMPDATGQNTTTDGFAYYQHTTAAEYDTHYVAQAPASSSSQHTRSTPISSLAALSRRPSAETLRTRASRVDSRGSR